MMRMRLDGPLCGGRRAGRKIERVQKLTREASLEMCPLFCAERIVTDAVTFFVVVNPIGLVPLFISTTRHELPSARRRIAGRSVIIAALILIVFIAVGEILLRALGITLPSFRIAGGLVLLAIAMKIRCGDLVERQTAWSQLQETVPRTDPTTGDADLEHAEAASAATLHR